MADPARIEISRNVSAGFEAVREAFAENFVRGSELGAACCVYHQGRKVVDLWGGIRNSAMGEPWQEELHGAGILGHQRPRRHGDGACAFTCAGLGKFRPIGANPLAAGPYIWVKTSNFRATTNRHSRAESRRRPEACLGPFPEMAGRPSARRGKAMG